MKNRKTKSKKQIRSEITVNSPGNPCTEYLRRSKEGLQWKGFTEKVYGTKIGFTEKEAFKPGMKD